MNDSPTASLNEQGLDHEELFPIREVARVTGINPVTLRAWERRYGLIQPTRTESGHRLYSSADIDEIRNILGWIERGVAVSKVGRILARHRGDEVPVVDLPESLVASDHLQWQSRIRQATRNFDETRLEQVYGQVFSIFPMDVVFQDILMPVWQGLRIPPEGYGRTSEWLFLDMFLRGRAWQRLLMTREKQDTRVVVAALPEHDSVLELLVCALMLSTCDIMVTVLAPGQPLDELALVCERMAPDALVLFSGVSSGTDLPRRLARLALALECPLLFAGEGAELAQDSLVNTRIVCLGGEGRLMQRRLRQCLDGHLDT